jgi:hypothetical protein
MCEENKVLYLSYTQVSERQLKAMLIKLTFIEKPEVDLGIVVGRLIINYVGIILRLEF